MDSGWREMSGRRLQVFLSSVMTPERKMKPFRRAALSTLRSYDFLKAWAFEDMPASTVDVPSWCVRNAADSDLLVWLPANSTSNITRREVEAAIDAERDLIVIKLPARQRDLVTEELLDRVRPLGRYDEVHGRDAVTRLQDQLGKAIDAWVLERHESNHYLDTGAHLEAMRRASRERCMSRWIGVPKDIAEELTDDRSVGASLPGQRAGARQRVLLVRGSLGSGKSLVLERMFQSAIDDVETHIAAIPVFIFASDVEGDLAEAARASANGIGDPDSAGIALFVDGLDEITPSRASSIIQSAKQLVASRPGSTATLSSRDIPALSEILKDVSAVDLPQLTTDQSKRLIERISGQTLDARRFENWPDVLKGAAARPLFAVLLANYLRSHPGTVTDPPAVSALIANLVESALLRERITPEEGYRLLGELARRSLDSDRPLVDPAGLGPPHALGPLIDSRLLVARDRRIGFPVEFLTYHFAAQAIALELVSIEDLVSDPPRLERWRYPLGVALMILQPEDAEELLVALAEESPELLARVLLEDVGPSGQPGVPEVSIAERAASVRTATGHWVSGLGPVSSLIYPLRDDDRLPSIGVRREDNLLVAYWYAGDGRMSDAIELPGSVDLKDWKHGSTAPQEPRLHEPWYWSLSEWATGLDRLLQCELLPIDEGGVLDSESQWLFALAIADRHPATFGSIKLGELEQRLALYGSSPTGAWHGRLFPLAGAARFLEDLRESGREHLQPPWPGPDIPEKHKYLEEWYSGARVLERTRLVFAGALEAYVELAEMWLEPFLSRMWHYSMLPASIRGRVFGGTDAIGPTVTWWFEALPVDADSVVEFSLGVDYDREHTEIVDHVVLRATHLQEELSSMRPQHGWLQIKTSSAIIDLLSPTPATDLAYHWLQEDFREMPWLKAARSSSSHRRRSVTAP